MKLRALAQKDAPLMLEWMHDPTVVGNMQTNFAAKTLEDCEAFIDFSHHSVSDIHLAIVDEEDIYMGTVSLKHIHEGMAEFAITVRSAAMGMGYARYGMQTILEHGLINLGLNAIYWCVSPENKRAVRFYDKNDYIRTEEVPDSLRLLYSRDLIWYVYR